MGDNRLLKLNITNTFKIEKTVMCYFKISFKS